MWNLLLNPKLNLYLFCFEKRFFFLHKPNNLRILTLMKSVFIFTALFTSICLCSVSIFIRKSLILFSLYHLNTHTHLKIGCCWRWDSSCCFLREQLLIWEEEDKEVEEEACWKGRRHFLVFLSSPLTFATHFPFTASNPQIIQLDFYYFSPFLKK